VGRPTDPLPRDVIAVERDADVLLLTSSRVLDTVRVHGEGVPSDDAFCLEPGCTRRVSGLSGDVRVTALDLAGT
jgi:hypothetical protein